MPVRSCCYDILACSSHFEADMASTDTANPPTQLNSPRDSAPSNQTSYQHVLLNRSQRHQFEGPT